MTIREQSYYALAALMDGPLHGYAIIKRAEDLSDGRVRMAAGTLYAALDPEATTELRDKVARARVVTVAHIPKTTITMNARIVVREKSGTERELALVYPWDAARNRVSVLSTLGTALLGASVGATVSDEGRNLQIASIAYQPEAAGDHHL